MKNKTVIIGIIIVLLLFLAVLVLRNTADNWLCVDGEWVKHGQPTAPQPTEPCGKVVIPEDKEKIKVLAPQPNIEISSPLEVSGEARGAWFFEASFPVRVEDDDGNVLARHYVTALTDWMTEDLVPFSGIIEFGTTTAERGFVVFEKDNPSGLVEYVEEKKIPVIFNNGMMEIKVFFGNNKTDPEAIHCERVYAVSRILEKTEAMGMAALEELLKGPTEVETDQGFFTSINEGVEINSLVVEDGVAKVDFNDRLGYQVGGSCLVTAIRAQIEATLKQFSSVEEVVISIVGEMDDVLQP